ncbi:MAG: sigma-70 family RNA polymerase sigma factor [Flavobacteriales bacterium]|nr:sigma-70 family RNA polymerase sigma factor [Flavobacteriales bacterium]
MTATQSKEFELSINKHYNSLFKFCVVKTFDTSIEAEDLLQETLYVTLKNYDRIKQKKALLSFMFSTANNIVRKKIRDKKSAISLDSIATHGLEYQSGLENSLDFEILMRAMELIPTAQKDALILFELIGYSVKEISQMQKASESAVKQRLKRGRENLKRIFAKDEDDSALYASVLFILNQKTELAPTLEKSLSGVYNAFSAQPAKINMISELWRRQQFWQLFKASGIGISCFVFSIFIYKTLFKEQPNITQSAVVPIKLKSEEKKVEPSKPHISLEKQIDQPRSSDIKPIYPIQIEALHPERPSNDLLKAHKKPPVAFPITEEPDSLNSFKVFSLEGIDKISLTYAEGDVRIFNGSSDKVELYFAKEDSALIAEHSQNGFPITAQKTNNGNTVHISIHAALIDTISQIKTKKRRFSIINFSKSVNIHSLPIYISVPKDKDLALDLKFNDLRIDELNNNLEVKHFEGNTSLGKIHGNLDLDIHYGNVLVESCEALGGKIFESKLVVNKSGSSDLKSKYSPILIKECENLKIKSFEDDIRIGKSESIDGIFQYGDLDFGNSKSFKLELFESDLKGNAVEHLELKSKYSDIEFQRIGSMDDFDSFEDDLEIGVLGSTSGNASYSSFEIDTLTKRMVLKSMEGEVELRKILPGFDSLKFDGKYTDYIFDYDKDLDFKIVAKYDYGDLELPSFNTFKMLEKFSDFDKNILIGTNGKTGEGTQEKPLFLFDCFDADIIFK